MMPPLAYFGIESHTFSLVVDLLIVFAAVVYVSLIYWTYADARRRILDPMLIGCATAASLFPFVGTLVYVILRPPEYLEDVQERELEMQAAEARLRQLDHGLCPHCDYPIERDFIRCPSCLRKLKERCASCAKPLDKAWTICPYCETDVPPEAPPRRRAGRSPAGRRTPADMTTTAESEELTVATYEDGRAAGATPEPASRRPELAPRTGRAGRPRPSTGRTEDLI
ncbi:MAG: double zinc ribbon domain-containing protein [Solirubrobacteraceae bacterium]